METVLSTPSVEASSSECLYCKTAKSPLWRMGPDGCKSLCNSCGNRFKRVVSRTEKSKFAPVNLVRVSAEMSPEAVLAGASDDDEPSWDEISEVAAKLTRLAETSRESTDSDGSSRKRKRRCDKAERANKRQELFRLIEERVETLCQEQEATDYQLEVLHTQILRQNNERVAMANLVSQLHNQISMLEQVLTERDHQVEELQTSVQLKTRLIATLASQGSWQV